MTGDGRDFHCVYVLLRVGVRNKATLAGSIIVARGAMECALFCSQGIGWFHLFGGCIGRNIHRNLIYKDTIFLTGLYHFSSFDSHSVIP